MTEVAYSKLFIAEHDVRLAIVLTEPCGFTQ